jgi:Rod binding domain-containing protein
VPTRDPSELARQFEGILVRQMLAESMKSLIDGPKGQQSYGYFISEALSDGITKGGGLGLRSVLESQLRGEVEVRRAAELRKQGLSGAAGK